MEPTEAASLIERRRMELHISVRSAAKSAGMSDGRWWQIAKGYQQVTSDVRAPVAAPPATLARMARAVGVSADELEHAGDVPAARALREMVSAASPGPLAAVTDDELLTELRRRLAHSREDVVGNAQHPAPIVTTEPAPEHQSTGQPSAPGEEAISPRGSIADPSRPHRARSRRRAES